MSIVDLFDPSINFWEANPSLIIAFKDFYKEDKSKNKEKSSKVMYFIAYCYDLSPNNKYRNQPVEENHSMWGEELFKDVKYYETNQEVLDPLIDKYCRMLDTPAMRALREWNDKMIERSKFIKDTKYGPDYLDIVFDVRGNEREVTVTGTWEFLDKMMSNTKKLYDDYQRIRKDLAIENNDETAKGGAMVSASDSGVI